MNIRKQLVKAIMWLTILGNMGVLIGCFLPFGKGYGGFGQEMDSSIFRNMFDGGDQKIRVAFVIMLIAVVVSWVVLSSFKGYQGLAVSSILLGIAILGRCIYAAIEEEMCYRVFYYIFMKEKGTGAIMIEWSYIALIIAGVTAYGVKVYDKCKSDKVKELMWEEKVQKASYRICPKCQKKVTEDSKFCSACGFSMEILTCPKCGTKREEDSLFCKECGEKIPVFEMMEDVNENVLVMQNIEADEMSDEEIDEIDYDKIQCMKCGQVFLWHERVCPKCGWDSKITV